MSDLQIPHLTNPSLVQLQEITDAIISKSIIIKNLNPENALIPLIESLALVTRALIDNDIG